MPSYLSSLNSYSQASANYKKHFTASAVVIERGSVLLVHHKRIGAWLSPGGHIEDNELPHQTAIREVKEETGLAVSIFSPNMPVTADAEAFFLPEPLCLHAVKAKEAKGTFYHIDIAYLCQLDEQYKQIADLPEILINDEIHNASWVELGKLEEMPLAKNVIEMIALAKSRMKLSG